MDEDGAGSPYVSDEFCIVLHPSQIPRYRRATQTGNEEPAATRP